MTENEISKSIVVNGLFEAVDLNAKAPRRKGAKGGGTATQSSIVFLNAKTPRKMDSLISLRLGVFASLR